MKRQHTLLIVIFSVVLPLTVVVAIVVLLNGDRKETAGVQHLSPSEFSEVIEQEQAVVIDVHTPEQAHITKNEFFIPEKDVPTSVLLPTDKDTPIAIYCRSGNMSARAANELTQMGYTNVSNLVGGKIAWDQYYQE
jgi:rhodanese-related sulfurtransferase